MGGGTNFLHKRGVGQRFYFKNGGDVADVDDEEDMKEANILLNEGNMLSEGSRIFSGPYTFLQGGDTKRTVKFGTMSQIGLTNDPPPSWDNLNIFAE